MKIGIIKEYKNPPDKRVVFSPEKCFEVVKKYPEVKFLIESSDIRCFSDDEYESIGLEIVDDLSECDILIGVKEVPIEKLIANKKYFFFSHTIKKQPYNKKLLQEILKKNIELYDHETIVDKSNNRLIGFGYYAGVIGAYNGFRTYGLKKKLFVIPKAIELKDRVEFNQTLKQIKIPNIKILLSGKGRVGSGTKEVLDFLKIKQVSPNDFIHKHFDEPNPIILFKNDGFKLSGQKEKAIEGLELLKEFKNISKNRIKIMPGSGINKSNIVSFKSFEEIHGSFKNEINTNILL